MICEIQALLEVDIEASAGVYVNNKHELEWIYFQTGAMKQMFNKFGEVLMIDSTFNVNSKKIPLFSIITTDGFGNGR